MRKFCRWRRFRLVAQAALGASLGACAAVDAGPDVARVRAEIADAVGREWTWPEDEPTAAQRVAELASDGLTADEAVEAAILNHPRVRAALARVGMARADAVQARLLTNPSLGVSGRMPEGGGLANLEVQIAQQIADLWMIPSRALAADRELERVILEVAEEVVGLAADVKTAYVNVLATDDALALAREHVPLTNKLVSITNSRFDAGMVGSLDVNLARGQVLKAEVVVRAARLEAATARRTLATLLGVITPANELVLRDALPSPRSPRLNDDRLLATARTARLDLRAADDLVAAAEARIAVEHARVFRDVELGVALERGERRAPTDRKLLADTARASVAAGQLTAPEIETRGQRQLARSEQIATIIGPTLSVSLPLFDQNQAQIAQAMFARDEAEAQRDALDRAIVQQTREAADRLASACDIAAFYDREVLPQAREALSLSEAAYQVGKTSILSVIDTQRSLLETRRAYIIAVQSAALALIELERAVGRPAHELLRDTPAASPPVGVSTSKAATEDAR